jgi:hypothetical protein
MRRASSGRSRRGRVLLSIGVRQDQVRLFERIVEAIGDLAMADYAPRASTSAM